MKKFILWGIRFYQKFLSPYKGFGCAYRIEGKGESCSAYGYSAISEHGVYLGHNMLRERLQACKVASKQRGSIDCGGCDSCLDILEIGELFKFKKNKKSEK